MWTTTTLTSFRASEISWSVGTFRALPGHNAEWAKSATYAASSQAISRVAHSFFAPFLGVLFPFPFWNMYVFLSPFWLKRPQKFYPPTAFPKDAEQNGNIRFSF